MANRCVVDELWETRGLVWKLDDRRRAAADAVSQILQPPHSDHEYLTAQLEVAHAHMVGRELADRAVMAVLQAPRPLKRDVEEAARRARRAATPATRMQPAVPAVDAVRASGRSVV